jgi:hypothetical protein
VNSVPSPDWIPPDACTLPTTEQPRRIAEFDELFATSLGAVEQPDPSAARVRLVLVGDDTLPARVR